jgi:L-amino acid N-acyltransferase YncA
MEIRPAKINDALSISEIYNYYVANSVISFEEEAVSESEMQHRISEVNSSSLPWLVADNNSEILGYAYATRWKARAAYRYSVEITIYLHNKFTGKGLGSKLYSSLFEALQDSGVNAVIGGVALPNPASVALHEKFGMEKVAHFKKVGYKFGQWVDVAYWQKELNA